MNILVERFFANLKVKNKVLVFQIALGIVVVVLLILLFPQTKNAMRLSRSVSEKRKLLKDIMYWTKNFHLLEQERDAVRAANADHLSRLPPQKDFAVLLGYISDVARQNSVKITAMEPRRFEDDPQLFYSKIPIGIDASCGYHELGKFVNDLEFGDKLVHVEELKVRSDPETTRRHFVLLTVQGICLKELGHVSTTAKPKETKSKGKKKKKR